MPARRVSITTLRVRDEANREPSNKDVFLLCLGEYEERGEGRDRGSFIRVLDRETRRQEAWRLWKYATARAHTRARTHTGACVVAGGRLRLWQGRRAAPVRNYPEARSPFLKYLSKLLYT